MTNINEQEKIKGLYEKAFDAQAPVLIGNDHLILSVTVKGSKLNKTIIKDKKEKIKELCQSVIWLDDIIVMCYSFCNDYKHKMATLLRK